MTLLFFSLCRCSGEREKGVVWWSRPKTIARNTVTKSSGGTNGPDDPGGPQNTAASVCWFSCLFGHLLFILHLLFSFSIHQHHIRSRGQRENGQLSAQNSAAAWTPSGGTPWSGCPRQPHGIALREPSATLNRIAGPCRSAPALLGCRAPAWRRAACLLPSHGDLAPATRAALALSRSVTSCPT